MLVQPSRRRRFTYDLVYRVIISIGLGFFRLLQLRFRTNGLEHVPTEGPGIIAITHFGYLDFALAEGEIWRRHRRVTRFMATAASWRHPISGPLMRGMHHIPVERGAGETAFPLAVEALKAGELVGVFPEASVSEIWKVKALKTGAVRMMLAAHAPLIPVAVWGGHRVITKGHPFSWKHSRRIPIHIEIGEPFVLLASESVIDATHRLRSTLQALVDIAQQDYPVPDGDQWWLAKD